MSIVVIIIIIKIIYLPTLPYLRDVGKAKMCGGYDKSVRIFRILEFKKARSIRTLRR